MQENGIIEFFFFLLYTSIPQIIDFYLLIRLISCPSNNANIKSRMCIGILPD